MLYEMDYDKITVQELSKRALINRKTFYSHYENLNSLLKELQHDMAQEFINRTKNMKRPLDMPQVTREFFIYSEELGKLAEKLNSNETHLSRNINNEIISQTWDLSQHFDMFVQNIITSFVSQSTFAIYRQWLSDNKKIPLDDIIKLATDLICNGLNSISNQKL